MQFNVVATILFAVSGSAADYARPVQTYTEPAAPRVYANGMVQDNGSPNDAFQINDIILTPAVPVAGQPLDVHLIGKLKKVIDKGSKASININYDGAEVMDIELDACEIAKDRKLKYQCPAQPEDIDYHHTLKIPLSSPKASYVINSYGTNQDNEPIFNVTIKHASQQGYKRT
ncbi:Phosphatidylglycerol/phosphatidylinositol transfer protein [Entomophthora muscae]|uniref:Phosphatidylglycerol/phosphatidylinositol transfer protein n=1 Tax=Entomophthora muscae TaxID=34485 RepID=A0ACC2TTN5_9FUNG|nr:Phosphatidylglycerol/phosphatidylinositol transfer protein [Entomophthora muscae]